MNGDLPVDVVANTLAYVGRKTNDYLTYALECYAPGASSDSDACRQYTRPRLNYRVDRNASCPFNDICQSQTGNLVFEPEPIDSHKHLGMNRGPHTVIKTQVHCAPLRTANFTETRTNNATSQISVRYKYGVSSDNLPYLYEAQTELSKADISWNYAFGFGDYRIR